MKYLLAILLLSGMPALFAAKSSDLVGTTMHTIIIYDGGSLKEALELANQWRIKVLDQMPQFKKVSYLLRKREENIYSLLVMRERYTEDENRSVKSISQAISEAFESDDERDAFFKALNKYINPKDNIVERYSIVERY